MMKGGAYLLHSALVFLIALEFDETRQRLFLFRMLTIGLPFVLLLEAFTLAQHSHIRHVDLLFTILLAAALLFAYLMPRETDEWTRRIEQRDSNGMVKLWIAMLAVVCCGISIATLLNPNVVIAMVTLRDVTTPLSASGIFASRHCCSALLLIALALWVIASEATLHRALPYIICGWLMVS
jgi:hypothetical protein